MLCFDLQGQCSVKPEALTGEQSNPTAGERHDSDFLHNCNRVFFTMYCLVTGQQTFFSLRIVWGAKPSMWKHIHDKQNTLVTVLIPNLTYWQKKTFNIRYVKAPAVFGTFTTVNILSFLFHELGLRHTQQLTDMFILHQNLVTSHRWAGASCSTTTTGDRYVRNAHQPHET